MWPFTLSGRLCIVALVGRYLTNQLMHRRSIHVQSLAAPLISLPCRSDTYPVLAPVSRRYPGHMGRLPTCYSPVRHWISEDIPFDLHVLGMPPAFILSQDRTLRSGPDSPALLEKKSLFARGSPRARSRSPADLGFNSSRNRRAQNLILCLLCLPVHFACLSSPISSIAVSGFQGSPRPVRPREEPIYAARGPRAASSPRSTEPPREARHREGGPGA